MQVEMGLVKRLILRKDAVPTIYPLGTCASTSQLDQHEGLPSSLRPAIRKREVAKMLVSEQPEDKNQYFPEDPAPAEHLQPQPDPTCAATDTGTQTNASDVIATRTIGTQTTLRPKRKKLPKKSKGVQVSIRPKVRSVAINCHRQGKRVRQTPMTSTPVKKARLHAAFEEMEAGLDTSDVSYQPEESHLDISDTESIFTPTAAHEETKFIVFKHCLWQLFESCPVCSHACSITSYCTGSLLTITQECPRCSFNRRWQSQPFLTSIPAGNLLLSAAVYMTGASFTKVQRVFQALKLQCISSKTYYSHAKKFVQPAIYWQWKFQQTEMLQHLKTMEGGLIVGGDMRADSPGHCAKYGTYSVMELRTNRIIDTVLVQSNEVGGSSHMEKEGLIRSTAFLEQSGLQLATLVTDRHPQIQKHVRENMKDTTHYYDVWHVVKGIVKKLEVLARQKQCEEIQPWIKSIANHLYWSAATATSGEEAVAKWMSVTNHVQDIHEHDTAEFPKCTHEHIERSNERKLWLRPGSKACEMLCQVVTRKRLLADVKKLSPLHQTSCIEAFHSLLLQFTPKNVVFSYKGMLCRLYLAVLHFNENADREQARNAGGELSFRVRFPKFKRGGYSVAPVKTKPTRDYIPTLLELLCQVVEHPQSYQDLFNSIQVPASVCSQYARPDKDVAAAQYTSRFMRKT